LNIFRSRISSLHHETGYDSSTVRTRQDEDGEIEEDGEDNEEDGELDDDDEEIVTT